MDVWTEVKHGRLDNVQDLIRTRPYPAFSQPAGPDLTSPLHEAILNRDLPMVELLCKVGVDMTYRPHRGPAASHTPLELARSLGRFGSSTVGRDIIARLARELEHSEAYAAQRAYVREMCEKREYERKIAFAMGYHDRLGEGSLVSRLETEVLAIVWKLTNV